MRLPGCVGPSADLGVLAVYFSKTRSVSEETIAGEMEVGRDELALGGESCDFEFRSDKTRPIDENGFRMKFLIPSFFDGRWCS